MRRRKFLLTSLLLSVLLIFQLISAAFAVENVETLVRVAFEPNLPPYQFLDQGTPKGVHIDLMDQIAKVNRYTLEYYPMNSQSECLAALESGEVDIVLGISPKTCSEYRNFFSDPLSELSVCALTKKDQAHLIRETLDNRTYVTSYQFKTIDYEYVSRIKAAQGVLAPNQLEALNYLISGVSDIMIGVKDTIQYQLEKLGLSDKYTIISNFVTPLTYAVIVPNRQMCQSINHALQQMQFSGKYEDILERWTLGNDYQIQQIISRSIGVFIVLLLLFLLVMIFISRLNIILKKRVEEKTTELQQQIIYTQNSNELRNKIFENSPFGIVVFDNDFSISLMNSSACNILGLEDVPIGQIWSQIPLFHQMLKEKMERVLDVGESFVNQQLQVHSIADQDIIYKYDIYRLYAQAGTIRGSVLFFQDVTEDVRMREHLYEQEKSITLNRMIAGIAHEIRNPLTAIKSFIELLPQAQEDTELRQQITDLVPREVDRIHNLLTNLTDYAKPNQNNKETFEVAPAIQTGITLVRHMIEKEQIRLNVSLEPGLVIYADQNQFRQVLLNIIINGFEAIQSLSNPRPPERSCVDISAWQDETLIHIQVTDHGPGMTETEIRKAMEPFYTQKPTGTGLGLYLSKQYMEGNQGTLEIESVKDKYTTVHITFRRLTWEKAIF